MPPTSVPTVYIADDDHDICDVLTRMLSLDGYTIKQYTDGASILADCQQHLPDVILMDIRMPVMDGITACAAVQTLPGGDRVPMLMITALDDYESIRRSFDAGATDFITKPINGAVLRQRVRRLIRSRYAEEALRLSEQKYRSVFEATKDALFIIDLASGVILDANPAACQLYGYRGDELGRLKITDISAEPESTWQTLRERMTYLSLRYHKRKNGDVFPIEVTLSYYADQDRQVSVVAVRDITERKRADDALRESEARFRTLADSAPVMVWMSGSDALYTFVNKPWLDFTNHTMEQDLGNGWTESVHPDDLQRCLDIYLTSFHAHREFRIEYRLRRADGVYRWVVDHGVPLFTAEGGLTGYIGSCIDITDMKEAQVELQRLAYQNELILTSAGEGISGLDDQGRITFVNPAVTRMTGYTAAELIGQHQHARLHHSRPDGTPYPATNCPIYLAFKDGQVHHMADEVFWRKDGSSFPVEYTSTPMRSGDRLVGAVVVFRDITARKQNEALTRKLSRAVEQSPAVIIITDPSGAIEYVNPRFTQLTGYTFDEVLGQNPRILKSNEMPSEVYQQLWSTILDGGEWRGEFHNRRKNGELFWEYASISPIIDQNGQITHFLAVKEDITARKHAEAEIARLRQVERTQLQLAEALRDTAAVLNSTLNLDEVLDRILDNVGRVVPHDAAGVMRIQAEAGHVMRCRGLPPETEQHLATLRYVIADIAALREMAETAQPMLIADIHTAAHWTPLPGLRALHAVIGVPIQSRQQLFGFLILISATPAFYTQAHASRLQTFADQAAIAIENARLYRLEREQFERWQLSQTRLAQAEKMAALGRLSAALAHEINNPLQAIQSHLELVMDFPLGNKERLELLKTARQEIDRLSGITHNVLNFARPAVAPRRVTHVNDLVRQTLALAGKQLQRSRIQVTTDLPAILAVFVAPEQMVQVFLNLTINAIEALPQGGQIHIAAHADSDHVILKFINDGPAIEPDDLPHIFEPFYTTKPEGTGLGLSISHSLVQQHGGSLTAANLTAEHGVIFTVRLPSAQLSEHDQ